MDERADLAAAGGRVGITRRGLLALGARRDRRGHRRSGRPGLAVGEAALDGGLPSGDPAGHRLAPEAWVTTAEEITFAVLGDNGSGGRNAMAVATAMADAYEDTPYGLVLLAGDISYYGSIDDRWRDVFVRPYRPLIEAGVRWELAIGNHEITEKRSPTRPARSRPSFAGSASPAPTT